MSDREKVIKDLEAYRDRDFIREGKNVFDSDPRYRKMIINNALALLKELKTKPLCCKECSYHRDDGWCNEHGREVKESDYCSFGAWEGR